MSATAREVLSSGRLGLSVQEEPWRCAYIDPGSDVVITEPDLVPGSPIGGFGFQSAESRRITWTGGPKRGWPGPDNMDPPAASYWSHAVSALDCRIELSSFSALLRTDDPAGRKLELEIRAGGHGVLSVSCAVAGSADGVVAIGHSFCDLPR
jgi:hypothetical protein